MSLRSWLHTPVVTIGILLCSAAGVLVATFGIDFAVGLLLPRIHYPAGDRLVEIWQTGVWSADAASSEVMMREASSNLVTSLSERTDVFEDVFVYDRTELRFDNDPRATDGITGSHDLLAGMGFTPHLGRFFQPEEDLTDRGRVLVLSYDTWQTRFGGDPDIVGKTLTAGREQRPYTVVGVLDSAAVFWQAYGPAPRFFLPLGHEAAQAKIENCCMMSLALLAPGVSLQEARSVVARIGQRHAAVDRERRRAKHPEQRPYVVPDEPVQAHVAQFRGLPIVIQQVGVVLSFLAHFPARVVRRSWAIGRRFLIPCLNRAMAFRG